MQGGSTNGWYDKMKRGVIGLMVLGRARGKRRKDSGTRIAAKDSGVRIAAKDSGTRITARG